MKTLTKIEALLENKEFSASYRLRIAAALIQFYLTNLEIEKTLRIIEMS